MERIRHSVASFFARVRAFLSRLRRRKQMYTRAELEKMGFSVDNQCLHCGGFHQVACPRVRRMRFAEGSQTPVEVEFFDHGQWPKDQVIWPWQVAALLKEGEPGPEPEKTFVITAAQAEDFLAFLNSQKLRRVK